MEDKEYYFKIEGRIYARDYDDALEQVESMAEPIKNCERVFRAIKEIK